MHFRIYVLTVEKIFYILFVLLGKIINFYHIFYVSKEMRL